MVLRIFALSLLFGLVYSASKFPVAEYPGIKECRVREEDCSTPSQSHITINYLKHLYGGCTHIIGNLVICDLRRLDNGSDPDLSFLESIQDVSGYVYLSRNSVRTIPLKSLRTIHGEPSYKVKGKDGAFIVSKNGLNRTYGLEIIDLRNLTAIQRHDVIAFDNPLLCNFAYTVDWEEIFLNPDKQRFRPDRHEELISQVGCDLEQTRRWCDGSCVMKNSRGYCWGQGPELCQKMVKCKNDPKRYCVDGPATDEFCQEECLGGCDGSPDKCRACKNVLNDGKCVSQCPPKLIVSRTDSRTIHNPDFKYNFHDICVKNCPPPFLKSDSYCVIECDLSTQTPVNGTCQRCPPSGCPKHCTEKSIYGGQERSVKILNSEALDKLKSCVFYTGSLYISRESFIKSAQNPSPITDVNQLWNLKNLKALVGFIYMDLRGAPSGLKNLTFLENLESVVMEVKRMSPGPVIMLMNGNELELLGFRSLTNIGGAVFLLNMTKLCYTSALTKMLPVRMQNVRSEATCASHNQVCHSECLPQAGCWGPGTNMCAHCCNLQAGEHCVSECTEIPGFYEVGQTIRQDMRQNQEQPLCKTLPLTQSQLQNMDPQAIKAAQIPPKQCSRCHPECAQTCYGPKADQCKGKCKHYQHNDTCVPECPRETYVETSTKRCLPCHDSCKHAFIASSTRLCSGPGDFLGLGGCTACWTVIQDPTTKNFQCLTSECPLRHFTESHQTSEFIEKEQIHVSPETKAVVSGMSEGGGLVRVCKPCHPFCDVCTANGTHVSICHSCIHWWFKTECVEECPPTETYFPRQQNATEHEEVINSSSPVDHNDRLRRYDIFAENSTLPEPEISAIPMDYILPMTALNQRRCLLCHEQCIQGCRGPGPGDCVDCRNYKVIIDENPRKFICNSSCPQTQPHVFHGMCLTAAKHARMSGRAAREFRDRIVIAVAVSVLVLIALATIILVVCLKRKADAEKMREKLRCAYTNLLEPDKESLMKNQSTAREPNMGRLEMINADDLEFDPTADPLGSGAFGVVYRGFWRVPKPALLKHGFHGEAKLDVAIKVIQSDPISPSLLASSPGFDSSTPRDPEEEAKRASMRANLEELLQEAKVMASVEYKYCLPIIGVCLSSDRHCLVSVFVELGSLDKYVREHKADLNSLIMLTWAEQIADGMSYLEMRGIIHRDLAARNVLVQRRDLVQITDFGLAKMLERRDEDSVVVTAGRVPIRWLAIETLQDSVYSHKTDVWTYGVTLWEIFTYGKRPYEDVETKDIKDHVMKGGRLTQPEICTLDVYMVMVKCWMEDYESRPTFAELTRTFHNFCKTPGRYLYIPGDEYAISYHANSYASAGDTHELQTLFPPRGVPDGSANVKRNGSLCRSDASGGTGAPLHSVRSAAGEYIQPYMGERSDQFLMGRSDEPEEMQALLPTRSISTGSGAHSMWPLRPRNAPNGQPSPRPRKADEAPLACGEDSWNGDVPGSAGWRNTRSSENNDGLHAPTNEAWQPASSAFDSTQNYTNSSFGPGPTASPSRDLDYLAVPPPPPPTRGPIEGYLEPRRSPLIANSSSKNTEVSNRPNATLDEYLTPRPAQPRGRPPPVGDFGISNMEYFMQPYLGNDNESRPDGAPSRSAAAPTLNALSDKPSSNKTKSDFDSGPET
ncbi:unnamed protein product [Calicophoron daubneyi]|uniref:receptor protein-tyrosine kinase n=1 Tax=Calicophoron daubneyi TaxID=300641 RepID=A0AAV2TJ34_CALDB